MHNNDVELRLPCQEGALGKASQISLVKIRNSMTKESKRINGSFLKEEKADRGKAGKFFKERKSFLMTQEKQKAVITQKRQLLIKGGHSF